MTYIIRCMGLCFALLVFANCQAQDNEAPDKNKHLAFKLNVTSLIDYTPGIQLAFGYKLLKKIYMQHEVGYITHYLSPFWDKEDNLHGLKIKNLIKNYWNYNSSHIKYYTGLDFTFKRTDFSQSNWFSMYDGAFMQEIRYPRNKTIFAFNVVGGIELPVINDAWLIDLYAGLGYRNLKVTNTYPDNAIIFNRGFFHKSAGQYHMPNISLGMRLGYVIHY